LSNSLNNFLCVINITMARIGVRKNNSVTIGRKNNRVSIGLGAKDSYVTPDKLMFPDYTPPAREIHEHKTNILAKEEMPTGLKKHHLEKKR